MEELVGGFNDLKGLILIIVALAGWSIRLEMVVKANARSAVDHTKELKMLFHKSDNLDAELQILKGRFDIVSSMMNPDNQKAHWIMLTGIQKDIEHLQEELERCRSG
jgi:hypothetical protein